MAPLQVSPPEPQGNGVVLLRLGAGEGLFEALRKLDEDGSTRVLLLASSPSRSWDDEDPLGMDADEIRQLAAIRRAHMPVIACIDGRCSGAYLSLALACDLRFASASAVLDAAAAAKRGAIDGATALALPPLIGSGEAFAQLFAAANCEAEKLPPGLVQRTFPKEELLSGSLAAATAIAAANGPLATALAKWQVHTLPTRQLNRAQAVSARLAAAARGGAEAREAAKAKVESRPASFGPFEGSSEVARLAQELLSAGAEVSPLEEPASQGAVAKPEASARLGVDFLDRGVVQLTLKCEGGACRWGPDLASELFQAVSWLDGEAWVRVVVIAGSGGEFLREGGDNVTEGTGRIRRFSDLRKTHMPVIACINGACRGPGIGLALAADVRFAARGAELAVDFTERAAEDDLGHMLPQLLGPGDALMLLLGGESLPAEKVPTGLMQRLCSPEDVLKETMEFATKLAVFSSLNSMAVIKWQTYNLPARNFDESTFMANAFAESNLFERNPDHAEGARIFGSGQTPNFGVFDPELPFVRLAAQYLSSPYSPPAPLQDYPDIAKPPDSGLEYDTILVEEQAFGVVLITLNKRTRMNAWGPDIDQEFFEVLDYYDSDPKTRVVVITGQGYFFCAGHDAEFTQDGDSLHEGRAKTGAIRQFADIRKMRTPTIACVNGAACGIGLSLALVCDIRFAAPDAKFGVIFPTRGLIGEEHTAYIIPQLVGVGDALPLLLTGENILAKDLPPGLVQRLCPRKDLLEETLAFAKQFARSAAPTAVAIARQQALQPPARAFEEALAIAGRLREAAGVDCAEAATAVKQGRPPTFSSYDCKAQECQLARELLGSFLARPWPLPRPRAKPPASAAAPKEAAAPAKAEPSKAAPPKPKAAAPAGPQPASQVFKVVASAGVSLRKSPNEDSPEASHLGKGETVALLEESFDGWAKLADGEGFVRRASPGSPASLEPEEGGPLLLAVPEPCEKSGARKFKVSLKAGVAIKSEPKLRAKVQSQKKLGETVIAEAQTYDGWLRLARNQGWVVAVGGAAGRMLEPLA